MHRKVIATIGFASLLVTATSRADSEAQAQVLFDRGRQLLLQDKWSEACPKFVASMKLDSSVGTLLNIAKCHEHVGALASALSDYQRALRLSRAEEAASRRESVQRHCQKHIARLKPRVPRLTIEIDTLLAGLTITRAGERFPVEALGEPLPVDPGTIEVVANAGDRRAVATITLAEAESATLQLKLRQPLALPPPEMDLPPEVEPPRTVDPIPAIIAPTGTPTWAWITGGAGIALGITGVAFGIDYSSAAAKLRSGCDADFMNCDFDPAATNARKNRDIALGWAFGSSGGIALTAAVIGIALGATTESAPETAIAPWFAGDVVGLQVSLP